MPKAQAHTVNCSFCSKRATDVMKVIAGPGQRVYICNECVDLCNDIIAGELPPDVPPELADTAVVDPQRLVALFDRLGGLETQVARLRHEVSKLLTDSANTSVSPNAPT